MKVEEYSFGRIKIGGKKYTTDVIVGKDLIIPNWWRKEGHRIQTNDVKDILAYKPEIVIFGIGANSRVVVDDEVRAKLESMGCEVIILPSDKAVAKYNEILKSKKRVLLAIHLTC